MDFSLTEEQQLLKDSVDRFVRENYEFESGYTTTLSEAALSSSTYPKGCVVRLIGDGQVMNNRMYFNIHATGGNPTASKQAVVSL